jgi:hypothetical protein
MVEGALAIQANLNNIYTRYDPASFTLMKDSSSEHGSCTVGAMRNEYHKSPKASY